MSLSLVFFDLLALPLGVPGVHRQVAPYVTLDLG
jgi:hypothetical protein